MNAETAGKTLFGHFQREHYHKPFADFGCGDADAYKVWVDDRWAETPLEVRDRYQAAAQNLVVSAQQSMHKDFAGAVFYLNTEGKPERIMSLKDMDESLELLKQEFNPNYRISGGRDSIPFLVGYVIHQFKNKLLAKDKGFNLFVDDLTTCLHAFSLMATSIGDEISHSEKNARLRGLISMIESVAKKVRDNRKDILSGCRYLSVDCFRSDYPVQRYISKITSLENEIKRLKGEEIDKEGEADSPE